MQPSTPKDQSKLARASCDVVDAKVISMANDLLNGEQFDDKSTDSNGQEQAEARNERSVVQAAAIQHKVASISPAMFYGRSHSPAVTSTVLLGQSRQMSPERIPAMSPGRMNQISTSAHRQISPGKMRQVSTSGLRQISPGKMRMPSWNPSVQPTGHLTPGSAGLRLRLGPQTHSSALR